MMEKNYLFFSFFMNFFTEFIFIFEGGIWRTYLFCLQSYIGGKNQKVFLYITVTNIKGDFFAIFNFKKKILFIGGNRKQKKIWREKYLRVFLETHFPIILSDSNSMYVYVLTTCSMIFLNVKTEHSKIIYLDSCSLLDEV